jgi:hypothetical protein
MRIFRDYVTVLYGRNGSALFSHYHGEGNMLEATKVVCADWSMQLYIVYYLYLNSSAKPEFIDYYYYYYIENLEIKYRVVGKLETHQLLTDC